MEQPFDPGAEEEPYKGYCGNCFKIHELPNCVECQHYRIKPGRCTTCGAVGPDDTEWTYTCLNQDEQYRPLMEFILEDRRNTIEEQKKKFTTYKKDKKIVNLIPRHLQTTTTIYADLPTAKEMGRMLHLSTQIRPVEQLTVMEELCNQTISLKEDITELKVELKRSLGLQIKDLKKDFQQEMQKFYTALMDDRIAALPQQFDRIREFCQNPL